MERPLSSGAEATLVGRAKGVLEGNWCGSYTKPAPKLYPHQWNWDSGFVAIGYAHYAQGRARQELESLFRGQWRNGMLPHIVFDPTATGYFPGPDRWEIHRSPDAPQDPQTSGITNPPVHAIAALHLYKHAPAEQGKAFLEFLFPKIKSQHRYLYSYRDPKREGLAYLRHPWESGTDNSPAWDEPLSRIDLTSFNLPPYQRRDLDVVSAEGRPTGKDYDRYVYLIEVYKRARYDEAALLEECPFLVQDPLFNSILCRAGEALIEIAEILGEDAGELREWHQQTRRGVDAKLWNEEKGLYGCFDLSTQRPLPADSISGFMPLFAGIPSPERARRLLARLESPGFAGRPAGCYAVPSYDMESELFDPVKYWRGPVWFNMDWMIYRGLTRYGFREKAEEIRRDTFDLLTQYGFHEYFSPYRSAHHGPVGGFGSPDFSWTAALWIDLVWEDADG